MPDENGELVTYLTSAEMVETVRVAISTIHRWSAVGLVRTTAALRGCRHYSLVDAVALRLSPPEPGTYRCTLEDRRKTKAFHDHEAQVTNPAANNREGWDDYDRGYVAERFTLGDQIEDIALELGRTYAAVTQCIQRLRHDGELPPCNFDLDGAWLEIAMPLLTPKEQASLARRRVAA
jgi:hypothetical protein